MAIDNLNVWAQFGLGGVVIAALLALISALLAFILYVIKEHRQEREAWMVELSEQRKEWISAYTQQSAVIDSRQKETNEVVRSLTTVVSESNVINRSRC